MKIERNGKIIVLDFNGDIKAQSFNLGWDDYILGINDNPFMLESFEHYHYEVGQEWAKLKKVLEENKLDDETA